MSVHKEIEDQVEDEAREKRDSLLEIYDCYLKSLSAREVKMLYASDFFVLPLRKRY